jgi:3-hydroxyacyl-[acyl-carrier-protein] dehydratase
MRFLMIDRVIQLEPGRRLVARKNVSLEAPYFQHHFPGMPVLPGTLGVEAMAQAAGYLMFRSGQEQDRRVTLPFLAGIGATRFLRLVRPGDQLTIEVTLRPGDDWRLQRAQASAQVDGETVMRSDLMMGATEYRGEEEYRPAAEHLHELRRILEGARRDLLHREPG